LISKLALSRRWFLALSIRHSAFGP